MNNVIINFKYKDGRIRSIFYHQGLYGLTINGYNPISAVIDLCDCKNDFKSDALRGVVNEIKDKLDNSVRNKRFEVIIKDSSNEL